MRKLVDRVDRAKHKHFVGCLHLVDRVDRVDRVKHKHFIGRIDILTPKVDIAKTLGFLQKNTKTSIKPVDRWTGYYPYRGLGAFTLTLSIGVSIESGLVHLSTISLVFLRKIAKTPMFYPCPPLMAL